MGAAAGLLQALFRRRLVAGLRSLQEHREDVAWSEANREPAQDLTVGAIAEDSVIANLFKSPAVSADLLERRLLRLPQAFRIAWLILRWQRRGLGGAVGQW